jgi:hypothetical protein
MRLLQDVVAAGVVVSVAIGLSTAPGAQTRPAAERFEVTSIKAVRPTLVNTIDALKRGDVGRAKDAFEAYDTAWNGIEVYINTRDRDMYNQLEKNYQTKIEEGLNAPKPDVADLLSNAQAMLAKFDEAIAKVSAGAPLSPLYDDVARLRIARSPLRVVNPAMKDGDAQKARKAFATFRANWSSVSAFVKTQSAEAYGAVEKAIPDLDAALKSQSPAIDQVTPLVNTIIGKINGVVFQLTSEARKSAA